MCYTINHGGLASRTVRQGRTLTWFVYMVATPKSRVA